jgi:hypothetical protein
MPQYPLFALGQNGKSTVVNAQRHLNLYAQIDRDADKANVTFYGTPGLSLFTSFGATPIRGNIAVGDYMYPVHRGTLWQVDNAGVQTSRGTLSTTSGRVRQATNGTQIATVDGTSMYAYTISGASFATVASNLFANPIDVTYQDGYIVACFLNSQRFQISSVNDMTTWAALDFASAQSAPDNLLRVISDHGELVLCGEYTIEFWGNSGNQDFPFSIIKGATLEFGLAAPDSIVKYNDSLAGLFKNRMGQVQVMMMQGHALQRISTDELDHVINSYSTKSDATGYSYMWGGHPFYVINFPSEGKTWLYDGSSGLWSELESGLSGMRHRAEIHVDYINKPRVTDYENGNIYTLDGDTYTDNGTAIKRQIISKHVFNGGKRLAISALELGMETGVGLATGQGSDPKVMLEVSRDGGRTYGNVIERSFGAIGRYITRVIFRRLGSAYDWVFKFTITDPVKVVITVANIDAEARK